MREARRSTRRVVALALVYLVFLLSGAAALVYQVVWTRSLGLVFGGSHLAVTTVLAVFMGGLATGGHVFGRKVRDPARALRLYGLLELGVAACAVAFVALLRLYPAVYVPLARLAPESPLYLSALRVAFAVLALIVPTTLMGGTLPVLSAFVSARVEDLGGRLAALYAGNTLGAVAGAGAAAFLLLRHTSVSTTLAVAVGMNLVLGVASLLLNDLAHGALAPSAPGEGEPAGGAAARAQAPDEGSGVAGGAAAGSGPGVPRDGLPFELVRWGIGVSGFCALGYEVLWTRVLGIVIGASVYGFTTMLMAFLSGIALGSAAYGGWLRRRGGPEAEGTATRAVVAFGLVQVAIGASAFVVTVLLRDLPSHALFLQGRLAGPAGGSFAARQAAGFLVAFSWMLVPAFFMGLAFPLAGRVRAERTRTVGRAVGETLAWNTVGAILGSAASGYVLVYAFGIERSLQLLSLVNAGLGVLVVVSVRGRRVLTWGTATAAFAAAVALAAAGDSLRAWDPRLLAVFQANRQDKFGSREKTRDALRNTDVLHYAEGVHAIVSSIKVKGGTQSFVTNGRVEATDNARDLACQLALGHLPMLLHRRPERVFVLGAGSGTTLGATSVHPGVKRITLAEIEPRVLGVARTFARWNHGVLDDPRLRVVENDGRNHLLTTTERFDVITADPVHPWFGGAGYLYTTEYFDLAADRLAQGGVMCQWLPIYELTEENLRSIVRTFQRSFAHVLVWMTYYDAHLVGSRSPIVIDEEDLARRIAEPRVLADLRHVEMGSAADLLSHFVMGSAGAAAYGRGGVLNTDDNLYLEFSAPFSIRRADLVASNFAGLVRHRESLLPYLEAPADEEARRRQAARCEADLRAAAVVDPVRARELGGGFRGPDCPPLVAELARSYEWYAPARFLREELRRKAATQPTVVDEAALPAVAAGGALVQVRLGAVVRRMTDEITTLDFVDGRDGTVLGHHEVLGRDAQARTAGIVAEVMARAREAHLAAAGEASARGEAAPRETTLVPRLRRAIAEALAGAG
jgi:spermidine synthase